MILASVARSSGKLFPLFKSATPVTYASEFIHTDIAGPLPITGHGTATGQDSWMTSLAGHMLYIPLEAKIRFARRLFRLA